MTLMTMSSNSHPWFRRKQNTNGPNEDQCSVFDEVFRAIGKREKK